MKNYKYREGEYKDDSTRGKALMRPKRYKGDSLVQVWIDRRWLASLSVWLESNGVRTIHMSDVLRESLRELYEHLIKTGAVSEIDTMEAGRLLEDRYRVDLNPSDRGKRNLLHNQLLSTYKGEELEFRSGVSKTDEMKEYVQTVHKVEVSENDPLVAIVKRTAMLHRKTNEIISEDNKTPINEVSEKPIPKDEMKTRLNAMTADERREFINSLKPKKKTKDSNIPRSKTAEELDADALRLEKKERDLMAALDANMMPARTSKGDLPKTDECTLPNS